MPSAIGAREDERREGEEPLGFRVGEREVRHTEVWGLHAC